MIAAAPEQTCSSRHLSRRRKQPLALGNRSLMHRRRLWREREAGRHTPAFDAVTRHIDGRTQWGAWVSLMLPPGARRGDAST